MSNESFPLLVPIEIKHVCVKAIASVQSLVLGKNATISVILMTEDGSHIDSRIYYLEAQAYDDWGSDDTYVQTYVQNKLAEEARG